MTTLVGVDVVHVAELDLLVRRGWFLRFVYAPEERDDAAFLTGRFAAKEAVLKVLRTGLAGPVPPAEVIIVGSAGGDVTVELRGAASARARTLGIARIDVSIAHRCELVIAIALGTGGS